jgi:hypothetical protein
MFNKLLGCLATVAACLVLAAPVGATPVPVGALPGGGSFELGSDGTSGPVPAFFASFLTKVNYAVYKEAGGTEDFLFQVQNLGGIDIHLLSNSTYAGYAITGLLQLTTAAGLPAVFVAPTAPASTPGSFITSAPLVGPTTVSFSMTLPAGFDSNIMVIQTNASSWSHLGASTVADGGDATVPPIVTVQPAGAVVAGVPEPASMLLAVGCFAGLGGSYALRRRRKRN